MTETTQPKKQNKGLLFAIVGIIAVAAAGGGTWYWMNAKNQALIAAATAQIPVKKMPLFMTIDPFIVTVRDSKQLYHMMLELDFMDYEQERLDRAKNFMPLIRNRVISVVNDKDFTYLTSDTVIVELEKELLSHLQQLQVELEQEPFLERIVITKLVIQ